MTQAILPSMKSRNTGTIINIGSIAGRVPYAGGAIYCASKAAVQAFTEAMRHELISTRIRIVNIDPGQVETEFSLVRFRGDEQAAKKVYEGVTPLTGQDIAEVIVFAASRNENVVIADVPPLRHVWLIVGTGVSEPSIWADANASKSNEIVMNGYQFLRR
jgi:3-hydroxy acid dehydrogenase/malonic semialdehyde reductase